MRGSNDADAATPLVESEDTEAGLGVGNVKGDDAPDVGDDE